MTEADFLTIIGEALIEHQASNPEKALGIIAEAHRIRMAALYPEIKS